MQVNSYLTSDETLVPTQALVLYESEQSAMATVHNVARVKPGENSPPFALGAGRPLTREAAETFMGSLVGGNRKRTLFPASLLAYESHWMLWWLPSAKRPIFFNTGNAAFNKAVSGKHVLHPALLFLAEPKKLSVWALADNNRPELTTPLYRAPYYNLYDAGNMCAGSVNLPALPVPGELGIWQEAFFLTNFTHTNYSASGVHGGKTCAHPDGHDGLWREMLATKAKTFPAEYLLPVAGLTLEKVLAQ